MTAIAQAKIAMSSNMSAILLDLMNANTKPKSGRTSLGKAKPSATTYASDKPRAKPNAKARTQARTRTHSSAHATRAAVGLHYQGKSLQPCESVGFLAKQMTQSIVRHVDEQMRPHDLTAMQWTPLFHIWRGRSNATELAQELGVDPSAMTRMLDRLEAKGLLVRERSQADRRVVRVQLTEAGLKIAQTFPELLARTLNHHLRDFSAEEVALFKGLLRRAIENGKTPLPMA